MVVSIFFDIINALLHLILVILPDFRIPDIVFSNILQIWNNMLGFDQVFALSDAFSAFAMIVLFHMMIMVVRWIFALVTLIRGGGNLPL